MELIDFPDADGGAIGPITSAKLYGDIVTRPRGGEALTPDAGTNSARARENEQAKGNCRTHGGLGAVRWLKIQEILGGPDPAGFRSG